MTQPSGLDENLVFEAWREATDEDKPKYLPKLVRLLQQHAYAVCWQRLGEKRKDLVNDAVWQALNKSNGFRGDSQFSTWFQTIITNLCNGALRKKEQRAEVSIEDLSHTELLEFEKHTSYEMPLDNLLMEQALKGIVGEEREIVDLKMKGMTNEEIAKELELQLSQVKTLWLRLKLRIKENLKR